MAIDVLNVLKKTDRYELREVMAYEKGDLPEIIRYDLQRHIYYSLEAPKIWDDVDYMSEIYEVPILEEPIYTSTRRGGHVEYFDKEYKIPITYEEFKELGGLCYETYSLFELTIDRNGMREYHLNDKREYFDIESVLEPYKKRIEMEKLERINSKYPKY